ncbi:unnamed protein product [Mytilus coruscus]|uniref:Homeobox domain-containing protein n=1 Tax=Mytilus coruscus TaxID=42192 RepID=A0A6J8D9V9_MYTCO|nr:unnamed protein product [Mytilus coruscus]
MASLIQSDKSQEETNEGLYKLSAHPMFQDLQATLVTECFQASVPYTLCSDQSISGGSDPEPIVDQSFAAVQEAHLQSQFQTLSPNNPKVHELQNFYSTQCAEIETQRCDAIAKLKGQIFQDETQYQTELFEVHTFHDRQRMHLTSRVSSSLDLLKEAMPSGSMVSSSKPKSRQLNARAIEIMTHWFERNLDNPYPSEIEKERMADEGNVSLGQVKAWFANKRNRTNNTKPKRQKIQVEKKLLTICSEIAGDDGRTPKLYGDIIQKLSNIINRSTVFNAGTPILSHDIISAENLGYHNQDTAIFSHGLLVADSTISSSDDNSNGST